MKKIIITTTLLIIFSVTAYSQDTIVFKVIVDYNPIQNTNKRLTVTFKFKDNEILKLTSGDNEIIIPPLTKELTYFEIKFDKFSCWMDMAGAEIEGKNIFNEKRKNMQIIIDTYPFSETTLLKFPKIKKNQYSIVLGYIDERPEGKGFGFFNSINTLK